MGKSHWKIKWIEYVFLDLIEINTFKIDVSSTSDLDANFCLTFQWISFEDDLSF